MGRLAIEHADYREHGSSSNRRGGLEREADANAELGISPSAVARDARNAVAKLGLRSRTELAASLAPFAPLGPDAG
ncbi:MAG: hypothetical protein KF819_21725 [Labilithrix sp.]|nr:hypothetical protein [Labilithrix sp.]